MKTGVIHYFNMHNGLFVVKLQDGTYSVFETHHIGAFKMNDQVHGYLDQTGIYEILNTASQKYHFVSIESVGLTVDEALQIARLLP